MKLIEATKTERVYLLEDEGMWVGGSFTLEGSNGHWEWVHKVRVPDSNQIRATARLLDGEDGY